MLAYMDIYGSVDEDLVTWRLAAPKGAHMLP